MGVVDLGSELANVYMTIPALWAPKEHWDWFTHCSTPFALVEHPGANKNVLPFSSYRVTTFSPFVTVLMHPHLQR
jgi:hypothetical protein